MEDYWLGVCVGWWFGIGVHWWLCRDRIKAYKNQVATLESIIEKKNNSSNYRG